MTANVTLLQMKTWCRARGELRAPNITDTELVAMINAGIADIHRVLLAHDKDRLLTSSDIDVVSGTETHSLPSDYFQAKGCDLLISGSGSTAVWENLARFNWGQRNRYRTTGSRRTTAYRLVGANVMLVPTPDWNQRAAAAPTGEGQAGLRLWYYPTATQLSADTDTWDSVGHWQEYVINRVLFMAAGKTGEDPSIFGALLKDMRGDLTSSMHADLGEPGRIRDLSTESATFEPDGWD